MKRPPTKHEPVAFAEKEKYELICKAFGDDAESHCVQDEGLCRLYLKSDLSLWVVLDPVDFAYFSQWKWSYSATPRGKLYARRSIKGQSKKMGEYTLRKPSNSLYLHREIQKRKGTKQPSPEHKFVDHRNGNSLDCRRANLRWATVSMNNTNIPDTEERAAQVAYLERRLAAE